MYQYSDRFKQFLHECENGKYKSPRDVPPDIFALDDWNFLPRAEAEKIFLPFIKYQIERALRTMPSIYLKPYRDAGVTSSESIESIEDFWKIPPLPKDGAAGHVGLREKVEQSGYVVVEPNDLEERRISTGAYFSGGTMGTAVPTFLTDWDIEIESQASIRGLYACGINPKSVILNTYNVSHKGGYVITKALCGLPGVHYIQAKNTDGPRNLIELIKNGSREGKEFLLVGAQPPIKEGDSQQKGSGRDLFSIIRENAKVYNDRVYRILLGGFRIIPEVERLSMQAPPVGKPLTTIFGSTEIMPAFYDTPYDKNNPEKICTFNNLHVMHGPHYIEVLKFDERFKRWVPAKVGEKGALALTSVFRQGTIYLRYLIGDVATIKRGEQDCGCGKTVNEVVTDIRRAGKEGETELILTGCAAL